MNNRSTNNDLKDKIKQSFPYNPYDIQLEFSLNLYESLNVKKLCIFESPTGTGKSLSLICGAFNWFKDNQENYDLIKGFKERRDKILLGEVNIDSKKEESNSLPAWLTNINDINRSIFYEKIQIQKNKLAQKAKSLKEFQMFRKEKMKIRYEEYKKNIIKQQKNNEQDKKEHQDEDEQYYVNWKEEQGGDAEIDIESMIEDYKKSKSQIRQNNEQDENDNENTTIKIIYASRTHSQIKQFVQEILKTKFKDMRVITLGSRQNLCLKFDEQSKQSLQQIDDYCQKAIGINKTDKSVPRCEYFTNLKLLQDDIDYLFLHNIHTLDQMRSESLNNQVCPYYLSKRSVIDAEVICVPYVTLLDENMRINSNIDITNSIILFDESHNILESLSGINSVEVTYKRIFQAFVQLLTYYDKFCRRLNPKNALFIQNIKNLCLDLLKFIKAEIDLNASIKSEQDYVKINNIQLLLKLNMDRIDFFQIKKFTQETRLGQKIHFFSQSPKYVPSQIPPQVNKSLKDINIQELLKNSPYMVVENVMNFLWKMQDSISKSEKYSIIIKNISKIEESSIQLMCLDVIEPLYKVIQESACVVLAGGTMEPLSEFELLINQVGKNNFKHFSCGHIIDEENCSVFCVSTLVEQSDKPLIFNYQNKKDDQLFQNSIDIIHQLAQTIPDGLVIFVQSYTFLEKLKSILLENQNLLQQIQQYKKIYMDDKDNSNNTILEKYQKEINKEKEIGSKKNGAILISVIGGRLSEGINFSDQLARCVVVFGMPYSNIKSAELIEKMNHYDSISKKNNFSFSGNDYYENLCMKSVNQAIGRSIRHKDDYSVILLIDQRFSQEKNINRLSSWIKKRVKPAHSFESTKKNIKIFFEKKQQHKI
ncbi:DNA repair helicase (rad3) (macronuclear) [Tetrahymena thermophila SB210]|uniref:DNA repair helicase (Rad3) n=1 Tax=Tetrahymena thermophila (strain SB210) TaxID=312017 RepID=I7M4I5_TETTS|nr:DNA repair helicase (rad3) [Tetrahymena thermophila SB210]EAS07112.2 DNA repair helicase (rad3) [Tetrahymena thermophila SB210]|eukprot:XP_001027354.2 DNA repair helicase (rad3) [Tetrahymena thermophila SB210]